MKKKETEGRENKKDGTFEYFSNSFIVDIIHQRMNRLKENQEGEDKTYLNILDFTASGKVKHKQEGSPAKQIMN